MLEGFGEYFMLKAVHSFHVIYDVLLSTYDSIKAHDGTAGNQREGVGEGG